MSTTLSPAGPTLTQARRVVWPFNRNRGLAGRTIGELLDAGHLARRDLEWAAANARSRGLQNACRVLLSEPERTRALCERPAIVLENESDCEQSAVALLEPPDVRSESPPMRWQDLIPPDFAPRLPREAPKPEPIPQACPVCGSAVRPDYRWTTRRRAGWRCDTHGLAHYLEAVYVPMLQAVYAPDAWVIPPSDDGTYPGVRRRDLASGPIGYWPEANRIGGKMLYTCAVCDEDVAAGTQSTLIVSGAVLVCPLCGGETVFDLSTPETRAEPYRLVEDLSIAAGFVGAVNAATMKARVDELHQRISWLMDQVLKWQKLAGAQRLDEPIGEERSTG